MADIKQISLEEPTLVTKPEKESTQPMNTLSASRSKTVPTRLIAVTLAVVAGLAGGYFFAQNRLSQADATGSGSILTQNPANASAIKVGDVFGSPDEKSFRDQATGVIQPGGVEGEGSHHLERGADKSQWVYLTSSVVDLDLFVTHEVELWGETFQGKKAGWLMDVGRLKVVKLNSAEINNIEPVE